MKKNNPVKILEYKKMVEHIDQLVSNDFCAEMEMKSLPKSPKYSQYEAMKMAGLLARIYSVAHCVHCKACNKKYEL